MKLYDKILAWFALVVFSFLGICVIIAIFFLIRKPFETDIRNHCGEIYTAKFRNILSWDGFDSIPKHGDISLSSRSQEICEAMNHLNKIEDNSSKDSRGYIEFFFYNSNTEYIGTIVLQYKPLSKGYYISFGFVNWYGCSMLADILLSEVKNKYPRIRNYSVHP